MSGLEKQQCMHSQLDLKRQESPAEAFHSLLCQTEPPVYFIGSYESSIFKEKQCLSNV